MRSVCSFLKLQRAFQVSLLVEDVGEVVNGPECVGVFRTQLSLQTGDSLLLKRSRSVKFAKPFQQDG